MKKSYALIFGVFFLVLAGISLVLTDNVKLGGLGFDSGISLTKNLIE